MLSIPPEIQALFVAEVWRSPNSNSTLSSLALALPGTVPFIRECRFRELQLGSMRSIHPPIATLMAIIDGAPEVGNIIKKIDIFNIIFTPLPHLPRLLSMAPNLEEIEVAHFVTYKGQLDPLGSCNRLTMISLVNVVIHHLSDILSVLLKLPYFTTLKLDWLHIRDIHTIICARSQDGNPLTDYLDALVTDMYHREAPQPLLVPQVSCLSLKLSHTSDLLLICYLFLSSKSPFPNLREIGLVIGSTNIQHHLVTLINTCKLSSLRVLDLVNDIYTDMSELVLPVSVEHFKFGMRSTYSVDPFCAFLLSSYRCRNLKSITVRMHVVEEGTPPGWERFDKVLSGMPYLERLEIEVDFDTTVRNKGCMEKEFTRCKMRINEGGLAGCIYVKT